jgi:multiple sugar transport system ATP-binding protein
MATVDIRSIRKDFGDQTAVDRVSVSVADGEFLVLLGPSGCGKTTLLRIIAGLERATSGDIFIGERNITRLPPRDRNISMVFQNYALYPHLTIYQNIAFPLRVHHVKKQEIDKKVKWAASLMKIDQLLDRKPRHVSGGERQRTALARSLVRDPLVFLLDEPLSNLDAKLRTSSRDELRQFQRRVGITTIYVTHDQVEAMGLGDRIAVMERGRIRQLGTPKEIYEEPLNTFVASFIGAPPMNLIEMDDNIIGFRPEKIIPHAMPDDSEKMVGLPFKVQRVEYLGGDQIVHGHLEPPWPSAKTIVRFPSSVDVSILEGERYEYAIQEKDVKRFSRSTGERIA